MEYTKDGFIKIEVKELIKWKGGNGEGCIASNRITRDGWKVGYMYREQPDKMKPDSGWRFMKGDETKEYTSSSSNANIFSLNTMCNYDPDIIPYLNSPVGSEFIRISDHEFVEDKKREREIHHVRQERFFE